MDTDRKALLHAGCSAVSWSTQDGKKLWGRNLDFNRMARGSMVTYLPRGGRYSTCLAETKEKPWAGEGTHTAAYAAVGTGLFLSTAAPVLYEGINEKGLMGGQLYYRQFARYEEVVRPDTSPIQPPFLVCHMLAQCATVEEVARAAEQEFTLVNRPMLGTVPPLHWMFSDAAGECVILEPDEDGLRVYRHTIGVMTNSPGYGWHRLNLLNYAGVRDMDYDEVEVEGERLSQCFSGSGAQGLPGDWSSPSRFVRLAFLKKYAVKGENEGQGVIRLFHMLQSAAFPLGMVKVSQPGHVTQLDQGVVPYDYTLYTGVMCAQSLRYYWTTYENPRIRCVDLNHLLSREEPVQFPLGEEPEFQCLTEGAL